MALPIQLVIEEGVKNEPFFGLRSIDFKLEHAQDKIDNWVPEGMSAIQKLSKVCMPEFLLKGVVGHQHSH